MRTLAIGAAVAGLGLGMAAAACGSNETTSANGGTGGSHVGASGGTGGTHAGGTGGGQAGGPYVWQPDNILNNGDFETGLMCWGNWIWSTTGQDYLGDYDFVLSSDAHGGSSSLEIQCNGSDCLKAAIYSNDIYTPPGQAYSLSLYSKCPAGSDAIVYIPATSTGELFQSLTCNDAWAENTLDFSADASGTPLNIYAYNRSTTWLRVDDVVLTYGDGTVPLQTIQHLGTRTVTLDSHAVSVDGSPYLALGFFDVPYGALEQVASLGANTATALGGQMGPDCFNTAQPSYLDHAFDLGINVVPDSTTTARLDDAPVFAKVMQRFAPHRANIAWLLVDEPDQQDVSWYYITAPTLVAEHDSARTVTGLPIMADFQRASWSSTAEVSPYSPSVELWMAEPYGSDFGGVDHAIDMFGSIQPRPVWLAQDPVDANLVVPKAWYVLVRGATGIIYFTWDGFQQDAAKLAAAGQAFGEIGSMKDAIFGTNVDAQVTAPAGVAFMARQSQSTTTIFAVNPTAQNAQGVFTVQGLAAGATVTVQFESRTITATAGQFSDTFAGASRHVYVIP